MITATATPRYSLGEEIANSITHAIGIVLAIAGLTIMTAFACISGNAWHITASAIFGSSMIVLYTASTLYHCIQRPRVKAVLQILDHSAIYLLIAGTYTPFTLVNLRGPWGWSLFGAVWGFAALGIIFQASKLRRYRKASLVLYTAMGWAVVVAIRPLLASLAPGGMLLLLLGGISYTAGIGFYIWRRLPYHHAVWHVFVLTGSILHFFTVLYYVIPVGNYLNG